MWALAHHLLAGSIVSTLEEIRQAMKLVAERNHVIAEGAGACTVAAGLSGKCGAGKIVCVVSGGNIDLAKFAELVTRVPGDVPRQAGVGVSRFATTTPNSGVLPSKPVVLGWGPSILSRVPHPFAQQKDGTKTASLIKILSGISLLPPFPKTGERWGTHVYHSVTHPAGDADFVELVA